MSNLTIYDQTKQELSEVSFVKDTLNQLRIAEIKDSVQILNQMASWISDTAFIAKIKDAVPLHQKKDIKEMILLRFKNLSFNELHYAFKMERFGILGDKTEHYQSFDAEYVGKVLDKYVAWKREVKVRENITKQAAPQSVTPQERADIRLKFLTNVFNDLKANGYSEDAWLLFSALEQDGKLTIGNSRKKEIYNEQKEKYLKQLKVNVLDRDMKHKIKKIISSEEQGKKNAEIVRRSKSYSVSEYLHDYLESFKVFHNHIENQNPPE